MWRGRVYVATSTQQGPARQEHLEGWAGRMGYSTGDGLAGVVGKGGRDGGPEKRKKKKLRNGINPQGTVPLRRYEVLCYIRPPNPFAGAALGAVLKCPAAAPPRGCLQIWPVCDRACSAGCPLHLHFRGSGGSGCGGFGQPCEPASQLLGKITPYLVPNNYTSDCARTGRSTVSHHPPPSALCLCFCIFGNLTWAKYHQLEKGPPTPLGWRGQAGDDALGNMRQVGSQKSTIAKASVKRGISSLMGPYGDKGWREEEKCQDTQTCNHVHE